MKIRRLALAACFLGISPAASWAFFFGPTPMPSPVSPVNPFSLMSPLGTGTMGPGSLVAPILVTAPLALSAVSVLGPALTPWGNPYFSNPYLNPYGSIQGPGFFPNPMMNPGGGSGFPLGAPALTPPFAPAPAAALPYGSSQAGRNPYLQPPAPPPNVNPYLRPY